MYFEKKGLLMLLKFAMGLTVFFMLDGCGTHKRVIYPVSAVNPVPINAPKLDNVEKYSYLSAINKIREKPRLCGHKMYTAAKPLHWNEMLYRASYEHSKDMAVSTHFSHRGSGRQSDWTARTQKLVHTSTFVDRIDNNGYKNYRALSENIAYGARSLAVVMQQWVGSDGHCQNIMSPNFTEFGMAKVESKNGTVYWTQNFGTR